MQTLVQNINDLKSAMATSTTLQDEFKADPVAAIQNVQQTPLETDKWIYRIVVSALGITILSIIIGVLIIVGTKGFQGDKSVPTILTAIGSAAIGALSGLLAPSPKAAKQ